MLGLAVDDLMARARLMKGQASIAATLGVFKSSGYGDIYGDPIDIAEIKLHDTIKPLMGVPLPLMLFGGLQKLFKMGKATSEAKLNSAITQAGASQKPSDRGRIQDPAMKAAVDKVLSEDASLVSRLNDHGVSRDQLIACLEATKSAQENGEAGDAYDHVFEQYGDVVANNWKKGNVPALMASVLDQAGENVTTGDPELDEAIITDVLNENDALMGDVEKDLDHEMGGLFTKSKINRAIKRGNRKKRKKTRQMAKQTRRDKKNNALVAARNYADEQYMTPSEDEGNMEYADNYIQQGGGDRYANEDTFNNYYDNDGSQNPDDMYNVDSFPIY
jgi:hypothetical protein